MEWSAENLRLSLFCDKPYKVTDADWTTITGQEEAETRQSVPARRTLSGAFQNGQLTLVASGTRLDCILTPKPAEDFPDGIPTIAEWTMACQSFVEATRPWLRSIPVNVLRIAFGSVLLARCSDRREAYATLLNLLQSLHGDPSRMRDLIYRINWPVDSKVEQNVTLNRLTSWSVVQALLRHIQLDSSGAFSRVEDFPESYLVRLEIDINTPAERLAFFDPDKLIPIYGELVALALENAQRGELP